MIAIFTNITDATKYSDAVHSWLIVNRVGYNAEKWADVYKSDTEEKWGVQIPVEQENVSLSDLICQDELSRAVLKAGGYPDGWTIADIDLFPYPDLNIRVFIEHKAITAMTESPAKLLIEYALTCTRVRDESGYTIWLSRLKNPQKSAAEVEGILRSFGAQILFSEHYVPEETQTILDSIYTSVVDGASYVWSGVTYIWDSVTGWFKW
jgi:hypothetical protein